MGAELELETSNETNEPNHNLIKAGRLTIFRKKEKEKKTLLAIRRRSRWQIQKKSEVQLGTETNPTRLIQP